MSLPLPPPTTGHPARGWSFLSALVLRDLRLRYRGSTLGALWVLLHPLVLVAVYTLLFSHALRVGIPRYPVFLLAGLLPWLSFSQGLHSATTSYLAACGVLRSLPAPRPMIPIGAALAQSIHLVLAFLILWPVALWTGPAPSWLALLATLPATVSLLGFAAGVGMALAPAHARWRDIGQVSHHVLRVWFFATPIAYSSDFLKGPLEVLLWLNPAAVLVRPFQCVFHTGAAPPLGMLVSGALWAAGACILGMAVHRRLDARGIEAL